MIDYETFCKLRHLYDNDGLNVTQIARVVGLDARTVATWLAETHFRPRRSARRAGKLDPFKPTVRRLIETHPYSAVQIPQRLREAGYDGSITILKDYLRTVCPRRAPAFLTLVFAPGGAAAPEAFVTVDTSGTDLRVIGSAERLGRVEIPRFSPDGSKVAYVLVEGSGSRNIWIHDLQLGTNAQLTSAGGVYSLTWSPDGEWIY